MHDTPPPDLAPPPPEPSFPQARVVLLVGLFVTIVLYTVPQLSFLAYPFMLLSTVAHEMGHGVTAVLVGGSFERLVMHADGSGFAVTAIGPDRISRAVVSAGGLLGPALAAAIMFRFARTPRRARITLGVIAGLLLLSLLLVVRGLFGTAFVLCFTLLLGVVVRRTRAWAGHLTLVFLAVQLALSVFSRADYLFMSVASTSGGVMPSDVAQMADALFLPFWFWGGVCGAISVAVLALGVRSYLRPVTR